MLLLGLLIVGGTKVFQYPAGTNVPLRSIITNYKKYSQRVLSILLGLKYSITQQGPKYHFKVLLQITKILPQSIINRAGTKVPLQRIITNYKNIATQYH